MSRIKVKTIFELDRPSFLDSDLIRLKTGGVTIDATKVSAGADGRKVLRAGYPVGKDTATGKYVPCVYNESTQVWEPTPEYLTLLDVDVTDGDADVPVFDWGRVIAAALPVTVNDALKAALPGITFVE